ncbi:uncharacterized protein LOC118485078 [Helianthus annuus]|uniref:uncharacterized protein LOC118485078 n=1 Tax=Helianthus annuus TaxID=4232 RepID=UPI0016532091|nr:uncharacterized protein LOC118485078 [Helianthus annuus]
MSLNQLSPIAQAEFETGTTTRPPQLKGAEDFSTWKTRIQSFFEYTDYNLWLSVTAGPHIPTVVRGDAVVANNDATTFTDEDKALIQRDRRAHVALTMALSTDDCNMFEEHRTANALWNGLIEYYEGNEELIESKKDMVQKQYDMFCGVRGESLSDHISRFLNMMTKMKKAGNPVTNRAAIKKLLDSLPKEWSLQCMMNKKDFLNNPNHVTLSDLINTLRAFEMDVNKREMNIAGGITPQASDLIYANASASASKAPQPGEKTITVGDTQALKVSTEKVAFFNMFLSSDKALISGELKKEMFIAEDMYQMAMITLRLNKFQDKTGKRLGLGKAGFDKSKLRCYNCKNLGHFKRDCPLLKEGNTESTAAVKQITVEENKNNVSPSTPKALVVEDYDWSEEIAEAKEQVNKALMAKISSESSSKQTAGIPKGDNVADKGLKSILTSMEPEKEKKSEKADEHVSEEASDQKKGKEKVPVAAMKTESSKEKAHKDLVNSIPHGFKVKLCTAACVDVVAHYKSLNLEFERQKDKALKFNNELKQNDAAYQRKKDFIINDLTDRLEKALNEKNKLQIIIDKWNVSQKAFTDIKNCQRPTYVKDGVGYKDRKGNERKLFFPPHSKNYVPMPTPHPENNLIDEKASVKQNDFCESERTANFSKSNTDPIKWLRMLMEYIWHVDSGCSRHMTGLKELLKNFRFIDGDFVSFAGDEKGGKIVGVGDVVSEALTLENVNYVPELCYNLMSVSQVCDKGISVLFNDMEYDFSRFSWVYFLEAKSETTEVLKSFIPLIENVTRLKVKSIRSDNGSEFKNQTFISFCAEKGIHLQYSAARTPQHNRVAERKNRTLIEAARTMLVDSKLPTIFWVEAVNTACHVLNRVLIVKPHGKTAYELLFKRKPLIDFFRPFGCSCTLLNTQENLIKFEAVGDICYFVGYSSTQKAYRVYNKRTKMVIESYYVDFQEGNYTNTGSTPDWFYDVGVIFNTFEIPEDAPEKEAVEDTQVEPLFDSSDIGLTPFTTRLSPSTSDPILSVNEATGDTSPENTQENGVSSSQANVDEPTQEDDPPVIYMDEHFKTNAGYKTNRNHPLENVIGAVEEGVRTRGQS